jgi:hypothetical protein
MSFIRQIKRKGRVYLAEVENKWVEGKVVQRHIRYVGREADGKTLLSASLSEVEVEQVKLYGPLLVLHHLAKRIGLPEQLGPYSQEILSLVYAHCLDYRSLNHMPQWFERTDLNFLLELWRFGSSGLTFNGDSSVFLVPGGRDTRCYNDESCRLRFTILLAEDERAI